MRKITQYYRDAKREIASFGIACLVALFLSLCTGLLFHQVGHFVSVTLALLLIFFLPGFSLSYSILPPQTTWWLLRFSLAITFSLAVQPVLLFYAGRLGAPVSLPTAFSLSILLTAAGFFFAIQRSPKKT